MIRNWLAEITNSNPRGRRPASSRRRPFLEFLEERRLLTTATYTVYSTTDYGYAVPGTLNWAISKADNVTPGDANIINFNLPAGSTIQLGYALPNVNGGVQIAIDGPGASDLTVAGQEANAVLFSVFSVLPGGTLAISGLTISHGYGTSGGAIDNSGSLTITNSVISNNLSLENGGGIENLGSLTINSSTFSGNVADNDGGAIDNGGTLTMTDATLSDNSADGSDDTTGGGGISGGGTLTIAGSTFSGNEASAGGGGGITVDGDSPVSIVNSTFYDNSAGSQGGGGIFAATAVTLIGCTIADNSAGSGGGIYSDFATITLADTIVAENTATGTGNPGPDAYHPLYYNTGLDSLGYNLIGDTSGTSGWLATDIQNENPLLGALQNNGGPTQTMALSAGSPAIDAGSALISGVTVPTIDQRGALRGPAGLNAGAAPDIGAYEASSSYLVTSPADDGSAGTLRAAISWADANVNVNPANSPAAPETIAFALPAHSTINLESSLLDLTASRIVIVGPGASTLTVDRDKALPSATEFSVFPIDMGATVAISGLTIADGDGDYGGGILNLGTVTITDCVISNNSATDVGGGLYNGGTATITGSTLSGNSTGTGDYGGGGVYNATGGTVTITNSTLLDNSGAFFGGGIANVGTAYVTNSTLYDNSTVDAGGDGGGFYNVGTATITCSTLADNTAYFGGGIDNDDYNNDLYLADSIVAGNTAASGYRGYDIFGPVKSLGFNLIGTTEGADGLVSTDIQNKNPQLGPLQNNGGPTQTMALLSGSPAIGAGAAYLAVDPTTGLPLTTDQRGALWSSAELNAGGAPDIGAYEATSSYLVMSTADDGSVGTLRAAVGWADVNINANQANSPAAPNTIEFDLPANSTINLESALPHLTAASIAVDGPGAGTLTVERDLALTTSTPFSVFVVDGGTTAVISGLTIANGYSVSGGGIDNSGTVRITDDTLADNSASLYGGGIFNVGTATISNSTLSDNSGSFLGGGIDNQGTMTIANSTLSGNSTPYFGGGGGIDNFGTVTIVGSTIADNSAASGGGIYTFGPLSAANLADTIVADNTASYSPPDVVPNGPDVTGTVNSLGYNLIGNTFAAGGFGSTDIQNENPLLGPLQNNGGPTETMALLSGSPAIDAASAALDVDPTTGLPLTTDQRGALRGPAGVDAGEAPDIGAYEASSSYLVTSTNPDGAPDTLVAAISWAAVNTNANPAASGSAPNTFVFDLPTSSTGQVQPVFTGISALTQYLPFGTKLVSFSGRLAAGSQTPAGDIIVVTLDGIPLLTTIGVGGGFAATFSGAAFDVASSPYTVTYEFPAQGNFLEAHDTSSLTITPAALTVTAANQTMTYGGTVPALTFTYTGLVNGDSSVRFTGSLEPSSTDAGDQAITQGDLAATGNYTIRTFVAGTLTVNAAPLVVTAVNQSMTYGGVVPALTYTYKGLVNGDASANFSGALKTTALSSSGVGGYAITEGNLAAKGNYTIGSFVAGTVMVNAAPLTVTASDQSVFYANTMPALTYTYTGLVNGDAAATFTGGLVTMAKSGSDIGGYAITEGTLAAIGNYTIGKYIAGTLTVNPAPLTVTAQDRVMTYGGVVPALTYTYSGDIGHIYGATFSGGLATLATSSSGVGVYAITQASLAVNKDFTISKFIAGTLTVDAAPLRVIANNQTMVYGGTVPALTYTYKGLVNGDTRAKFSGSLATLATSSSGVGVYAITQGNLAALGNYTIGTFIAGTLTVSAASGKAAANNPSVSYGAAAAAIVGLADGDSAGTTVGSLAGSAEVGLDVRIKPRADRLVKLHGLRTFLEELGESNA